MSTPPPGLDPRLVTAHLPSARARFEAAVHATGHHLDTHGGYVAWSGGNDSTVAVHLAITTHPQVPVVWFNSGLEFPDTRPYIERLAERLHLNLHVIDAEPDALTILAQSGAWDHAREPDWSTPDLHDALVTTPARAARAAHGHAETWGLRVAESQARKRLLAPGQGHHRRADGTHTYAPIWAWSAHHVSAYLAAHHIDENPAYARLRAAGATGRDLRVGVALDGNNLNYGRLTWLRRAYPDLYHHIEQHLPRIREWT